ncbi:MAG: hypothetical protein FWF01_01255 [Alphaproteobacteria bacterium]|nr:hypothetical protein [Alphaproteobacteria bacterium]
MNDVKNELAAMLDVMKQLCQILERENSALQQHKVAQLKETMADKIRLSDVYAKQFKTLTSDRAAFKAVAMEEKNALIGSASHLNSLMDDNARLIKANMAASKKLLDAIIAEAKKAQAQAEGGDAVYARPRGKKGDNVSLSFNQVL